MKKSKLPNESKETYVTYVNRPALYNGAFRFSKILTFFDKEGRGKSSTTCEKLPEFPLMQKTQKNINLN